MIGSSGSSVAERSDLSWSESCLEGAWLVLWVSLVFENAEAVLLAGSGKKVSLI